MAKHNLALLLRDGKGAPRNGKEAVELLRSAARQGMAASMFTLGDIYERGDEGLKDPAIALAWFAITAEFERQTNRGGESALAKMASQRVQVLQRILMPGELERAQQFGQAEFKQIVEALQPPKPAAPPPTETAGLPRPAFPPLPPRRACIGASGLAQGRHRSDPRHPAGPGRSQAPARQARWRVGPDDPQRHPRFPAQRGDARDRRPDRRRVRGAAGRDQGRDSEA